MSKGIYRSKFQIPPPPTCISIYPLQKYAIFTPNAPVCLYCITGILHLFYSVNFQFSLYISSFPFLRFSYAFFLVSYIFPVHLFFFPYYFSQDDML